MQIFMFILRVKNKSIPKKAESKKGFFLNKTKSKIFPIYDNFSFLGPLEIKAKNTDVRN